MAATRQQNRIVDTTNMMTKGEELASKGEHHGNEQSEDKVVEQSHDKCDKMKKGELANTSDLKDDDWKNIIYKKGEITKRCQLTSLPPEIHLNIFDHLEVTPAAIACLGLTCKKFYPLFSARHKKISLDHLVCGCNWNKDRGGRGYPCYFCEEPFCGTTKLHTLLNKWAGPQLMYAGHPLKKFTTPQRAKELQEVLWGGKASRREELEEFITWLKA